MINPAHIAVGLAVAVVVVVCIVVGVRCHLDDRRHEKRMASLPGWRKLPKGERCFPRRAYTPQKTCEGCRHRVGNECHHVRPYVIGPECSASVWPTIQYDDRCDDWDADVCLRCGGWGYLVDTRLIPEYGEMTTGWWRYCPVCDGVGRMKAHHGDRGGEGW